MQRGAADVQLTPDVLVLGGGGVLGEAWISAVLAGLDEQPRFDASQCGSYLGTSAGSIVATYLVAGVSPAERLGALPEASSGSEALRPGPIPARRMRSLATGLSSAAVSPLVAMTLTSTAAGGALMRRAALGQLPRGARTLAPLANELKKINARWDERLRIAVVELSSGRRVILDAERGRKLPVERAVQASCAIPGVFRPVRVEGRAYVDGGVWSPTNLDAARVRRGDRVLCLSPTGSLRPSIGNPAGAIGPLSRLATAAEVMALQRRGARVTTISPDEPTLRAISANLMDPRPRATVIAAGLAQGRRIASHPDLREAA